MSKLEIYLASMISISLGFVFNFFILMIFILFSDIELGMNILYLPLHFVVLFFFSFGIALILSNIFVKAKDIQQIWPLVSHMMMWMSPIFFLGSMLKSGIPFIEYINPMFGIVTNFRDAVMYNKAPNFEILALNTLQAVLVMVVGLFLLKKIGKKASEIL
jgi:ABC-type polysaccharide/polyol phosphate export permease